MSETLLRAFTETEMISVDGLPWQKGQARPVSIKSLASNILCKRHNEALSPLDTVSRRFFDAIDQIDKEFRDSTQATIERVFLFNGHDIERWMLKVLCGAGVSGNAATADLQSIRGWTPPVQWQQILFGVEPFPYGWGMYYDGMPGDVFDVSRDVGFGPVYDGSNILGAITLFNAHRFYLVMSDANRTTGLLERTTYRPKELCVTNGTTIKMVSFGWDVPGDDLAIHIDQGRRQ